MYEITQVDEGSEANWWANIHDISDNARLMKVNSPPTNKRDH